MKTLFFIFITTFIGAYAQAGDLHGSDQPTRLEHQISDKFFLEAGEYLITFSRLDYCSPSELNFTKELRHQGNEIVFHLNGIVRDDIIRPEVCRYGLVTGTVYLDLRHLAPHQAVSVKAVRKHIQGTPLPVSPTITKEFLVSIREITAAESINFTIEK